MCRYFVISALKVPFSSSVTRRDGVLSGACFDHGGNHNFGPRFFAFYFDRRMQYQSFGWHIVLHERAYTVKCLKAAVSLWWSQDLKSHLEPDIFNLVIKRFSEVS